MTNGNSARCQYCDGTGSVHRIDGEYLGECTECPASVEHKFENFHRQLCERFGYVHDEKDWKRDQVSLIEWIAKRVCADGGKGEAVKVTAQGVQFGNAWYSHEKITGYSAEQLNSGDCRVTGRAYMTWVQSMLAAPQAECAPRYYVPPVDCDESLDVPPYAECEPRADEYRDGTEHSQVLADLSAGEFKPMFPELQTPERADEFESTLNEFAATQRLIGENGNTQKLTEHSNMLYEKLMATKSPRVDVPRAIHDQVCDKYDKLEVEHEALKLRADAEKDATLTDEDIERLWVEHKSTRALPNIREFARAIEAAILAANKDKKA